MAEGVLGAGLRFFFLGKFFHLGELGAAGMDGREYGYINTVSEISNSARLAGTCDGWYAEN